MGDSSGTDVRTGHGLVETKGIGEFIPILGFTLSICIAVAMGGGGEYRASLRNR